MIDLEKAYLFAGLVFAGFALLSLRDPTNPRRLGNATFWGLLAASFLFGFHLSDLENGVLAFALAIVGGLGLMGRGRHAEASKQTQVEIAHNRGNWLFVPALLIPATALVGTMVFPHLNLESRPLVDPKQVTVISLALGVLVAWIAAAVWLKPSPLVPLQEGRRLMDTIGWAAVLPQMLASLGAVFALAGVGGAVGALATHTIPLDTPLSAVVTYCLGMALFTAIMGNAFAAFPVMTAAIGLPLIVHKFGGSPAIMSALGMLSGFCGTLTTPMAANFNIVPAALLELDRNAVIRVQLPTAFLLLLCNTLLMYFLVFHFGSHHA